MSTNGSECLREETDSDVGHNGEKKKVAGWDTLKTFCETTTFHGLRNIAEPNYTIARRSLWVIILLTSTSIFAYQCHDRVSIYLNWPTNTNIALQNDKPAVFPAVTICNQNAFRITEVKKNGMYYWLKDMYADSYLSAMTSFNASEWSIGNVTMLDVFLQNAHRKEDMIAACTWQGKSCSHEDFDQILTDAGVCYTFNGRLDNNSVVNETGVKQGLQLLLNIEHYQYTKGPHNAVGLKLLLHAQDEIPQVENFGDAIPVGMHIFVAVDMSTETNLPPPHGDCMELETLRYFARYTQTACYTECSVNFVVERCGCRDFYMPGFNKGDPPVCDVIQYITCLLPTMEVFSERRSHLCHCPVDCKVTNYRSSTSYAEVAKDDNRKFALPDEYTANIQKSLSESIDAKEHLEHRFHNGELIYYALDEYFYIFDGYTVDEFINKTHETIYSFAESATFILEFGTGEMKTILQNRFRLPWNVIHFETSLASLNDLCKAIIHSIEMVHRMSWRAAVQVRLEEERQAAFYMQMELDQLQTAYLDGHGFYTNVIKYNKSKSVYVKVATLDDNETVNEIYERLIGHFQNYVANIDALLRMNNCSDGDVNESYVESYLRYASGFQQVVVEYLDDLTLYERFIIEKPLKTVAEAEKKIMEYLLDDYRAVIERMESDVDYLYTLKNKLEHYIDNVRRDDTVIMLLSYGRSLFENNMSVSMVGIASTFASKELFRTIEDSAGLIKEATFKLQLFTQHIKELHDSECAFLSKVASEPLLTELFKRLDRYTYDDYFSSHPNVETEKIRKVITGKFICGNWSEPTTFEQMTSYLILEEVEALKSKLTTLLKQTQLNGVFYSENFLKLNIYMRDLGVRTLEQQEAYSVIGMLGDIGGSMGMFIGASIITLLEAIDMFLGALAPRRHM